MLQRSTFKGLPLNTHRDTRRACERLMRVLLLTLKAYCNMKYRHQHLLPCVEMLTDYMAQCGARTCLARVAERTRFLNMSPFTILWPYSSACLCKNSWTTLQTRRFQRGENGQYHSNTSMSRENAWQREYSCERQTHRRHKMGAKTWARANKKMHVTLPALRSFGISARS